MADSETRSETSGPDADSAPGFEAALARLETLVAEMESGRLTLDQVMARFEEGMRLAKICTAKLGETEKKIEMLVRRDNGSGDWAPFAGMDDHAAPDGNG
jgi:exodeoxyribonuclease VII small subunit